MKLDTEFCQLPLRLDAQRLADEVKEFAESDWRPHPQGHAGNTGLSLVAVGGDPTNNDVRGPQRPTPLLARCPYITQVLASLQTVLGRTRLMRIDAGAEATEHVDTNYYWLERVRVHVPIVTTPEVRFICDAQSIHMAAGEVWIFDTFRRHNVVNPGSTPRIHLVVDTVGSPKFWDLVAQGHRPFAARKQSVMTAHEVPYREGLQVDLDYENVNFPLVMSPWEQESLAADVLDHLANSSEAPAETVEKLKTAVG